ncbi:MAG: hypothetical protein FJW79_01620 [Actinobacteria bacterium]|nr:hypothetical protein [Actinomycetota bacterium]
MKKLLRFLLFVAVIAGVVAAVSRIRERLAAPVRLGSPETPAGEPPASSAPLPAAGDLAAIKGIGPVYRARLEEAGLATFAALAAAPPARVAAAAGIPAARAADWIAQAAALGGD